MIGPARRANSTSVAGLCRTDQGSDHGPYIDNGLERLLLWGAQVRLIGVVGGPGSCVVWSGSGLQWNSSIKRGTGVKSGRTDVPNVL